VTEAALRVIAHHQVPELSVDQEIDLWRALAGVVRRARSMNLQVGGGSIRDDFLAELTAAASQVSLGYSFRDSFLDLTTELWRTLERVVSGGKFGPPFFQALRVPPKAYVGESQPPCLVALGTAYGI
jgi:hypothetical protein